MVVLATTIPAAPSSQAVADRRIAGLVSRSGEILTSTGRFFSAGGDLKFFHDNADRVGHVLKETTSYLHAAQSRFARMAAPVVVAINGIAAGGGASIAFCGDIVLAAQSATFTMGYTAAGLSPDGSSSYDLPRLAGRNAWAA